MSRDTFLCPLCQKVGKGEMFHCRDHCMDMCADHVTESGTGRFICRECNKVVYRLRYDGLQWVEG